MCQCDGSDFLTTSKFLKFVFSLFRTFNFSRDERVQNRLL